MVFLKFRRLKGKLDLKTMLFPQLYAYTDLGFFYKLNATDFFGKANRKMQARIPANKNWMIFSG